MNLAARRFTLFVCTLAWVPVPAQNLAQSLAPSLRPDAVQPRHGHPYLLFTADDIQRFKQRVAQESNTAAEWQRILQDADQAIDKQVSSTSAPMEELCLAWRMSGDPRYAGAIERILESMAARTDFSDPALLERNPPWHSGLGTANLTYEFAIGFDSIHDYLSPAQRKNLAHALADKGVKLAIEDWVSGSERIHSLDTMGHNWWSAVVFNAGIGSIAILDEEPRARTWLAKIDEASVEWMSYQGSALETKPATFDREGGFYESVGYADYAVNQFLRFRLAWTHALTAKPASLPVIDTMADLFCNVTYELHGSMVSTFFGDGNLHATGRDAVALAWANGLHKPSYLWFLARFHQLADPKPHVIELVYGPTQRELEQVPPTPAIPVSKLFPGMGWATLRSSWDKDATLLGVKSGFTWNHSHADAGSFVLFHGGDYLLVDSGATNYDSPEYDRYFRQSRAHNVVLFNGEAENPEDTYFGSQFPGSVSHLLDDGDLKYVFADATGPTTWRFIRNFRHFLWIGDVILILDDVKSYEPGQFEWTFHVNGKTKRKNLDLEVAGASSSVLVRPLFPETLPGRAGLPTDYPEKMRLVEKIGLKDHDNVSPDTYFAFAPAEQTRRTKFMVAITLVNAKNREHLPTFERFQTIDSEGVRIHQNGTVTEVYMNLLADGSIRHRNANANIAGWETDAYLMALTFSEGVDTTSFDNATRLFIADGSYLRRSGTTVFDSLSKLFLVESNVKNHVQMLLEGQPNLNVQIYSSQRPASIQINGVPATLPYDAASRSFTAHIGTAGRSSP